MPKEHETARAAGVLPGHESGGLHVDLYELTMAAGYFDAGRQSEVAHFELFIRKSPPSRSFYLFCGLDTVLGFIESFGFPPDDIEYLKSLPALHRLPGAFFEHLAGIEFTGDLFAFPEGSLVFPDEPLIRIRAPIIEAQLLETALLAIVNHQTTVATKAARVVYAARGRDVIEFGSRRAHGLGAALLGARAAIIGGCSATSNCIAGKMFGLDVVGTIAHSWVMSFPSEEEAFDAYASTFPDGVFLLLDTYDTLDAARLAARYGDKLKGVRLDSGDLARLSKEVRRILDDGGALDAIIFASGDLNEYKITKLLDAGAPIDAFGVGSEMITSRDEPSLGGVYKLAAIEEPDGERIILKRKLSSDKATLPGPKQVWRSSGDDGMYTGDVIALVDEPPRPGSESLIHRFIRAGKRVRDVPHAYEIRARAEAEFARFPPSLFDLDGGFAYPVGISSELAELASGTRTSISRRWESTTRER